MLPCVYAPLDTRRPHGDSHSLLLQTNGAGAHSQLGRESIKNFDSCCLCLQPVIEPMSWCAFHTFSSQGRHSALCSHKGHIFCKECIYQNLLTQKQHIARDLKLYEKAQENKKVRSFFALFSGSTSLLTGGRERM